MIRVAVSEDAHKENEFYRSEVLLTRRPQTVLRNKHAGLVYTPE